MDTSTPPATAPTAAKSGSSFRERLFHVLVDDRLCEMEVELLAVKSMAAIAAHPWRGGKRLRPITMLLAWLAIRAARNEPTDVIGREVHLAAALELLHEASLVHDDIVDQSVLRRGEPTVQVTRGAGRALLIGDYLMFRALKMVVDCTESHGDVLLAKGMIDAGLEMVHGQIDQIEQYIGASTAEQRMSMPRYLDVIGKKTALLFAGSAEGGAALAGATDEQRKTLHTFGMELGLAFQMLDDLIDVLGDPSGAGKSLANNLKEGTVTAPFVVAWQLRPEHPEIRRFAEGEELDEAQQQRCLEAVRADDVVDRCLVLIDEHRHAALTALAQIPGSIYTAGLADLMSYIRECRWGGISRDLSPRVAVR